jgi:phage baseplate assembly protein W
VSTLFNIARPLSIGDDGAFQSDLSINDVVKQNLKNLLLTQKGERVHKRNFGCNLNRLLFEQKTEQLKISIAEEIIKAVSNWANYIILDSISIFFSGDLISDKFRFLQPPEENQVKIVIEYHVDMNSKTIKDMLELTVEIAGE